MTEQEQRLKELMERDRQERVGTARQEILDTVNNEGDPYGLADAFREMTPFDKALGHLYGKLMQATGNAQVDNAFIWFESEYAEHLGNKPFDSLQKNMILTNVMQQIIGADESGYRTLRQVLVRLNQK